MEILILIPVVTAMFCFLTPNIRMTRAFSVIGSAAALAVAAPICYDAFTGGITEYSIWYIDGLSALFTILTVTVGAMVSVYSVGYLKKDKENGLISQKDERNYFALFQMFTAVMLLVCLVSSVGVLWITIEATTLISAFLVGFYKKEGSTEAAWKYLMICSVGITLALVGITLVYASSISILGNEDPSALDWNVLFSVAAELDPALLKVAFIFIMVGFGTKMGLVPMHTWLPDAHSQAPTPVSAMLSAVLLNSALYSIIRFKMIADVAIPGFSQNLMIFFGITSMAVAAAFILTSKNLKRMLAYSSIEHMGLIAVGLGIGSPIAVFGALFHVIAHSLSKSFAFLSAGNVIQEYGTTDMDKIRGMRQRMPFNSAMITAASFAMIGLPPFAIFVSELSILQGAIDSGMYILTGIIIILILAVFAGFIRNVFPMLSGTTEKEVNDQKDITRTLPLLILLGAILFLGLFMPESVKDAISSIVSVMTGGSP